MVWSRKVERYFVGVRAISVYEDALGSLTRRATNWKKKCRPINTVRDSPFDGVPNCGGVIGQSRPTYAWSKRLRLSNISH
jgi:hypothetical protein